MASGDFKRFVANIPQRDKPLLIAVATAALLLLAWLVIYNAIVIPVHRANMAAEAKRNLHSVQLAVERYAVDTDGSYPTRVTQTLEAGYLDALPTNPYTGQPMRELRLGDPPSQGDFYYLPFGPARAQASATPGSTPPPEVDSYRLVLCLNPDDPLPLDVPKDCTLLSP